MTTSLLDPVAARGFNGIAETLRRALLAGELTPGEQLPPIGELARQYATTAITVRRALRALEEEGLVRVEHGVGTFVADWSRQFDALHLPSFAAEMAARDLRPETEVRGRTLDAQHAEAATALRQPAEAVHVLTRRRLVGGAPVVLQHSYLSAGLRSVVERYSPERSLYEMVREATGRAPLAAEETVRATVLIDDVARELAVETSPAVGWVAVRTTYDALGQPLVYDEAFFPSERVEIQIHRRAGVTQLGYRMLAGYGGDGVATE